MILEVLHEQVGVEKASLKSVKKTIKGYTPRHCTTLIYHLRLSLPQLNLNESKLLTKLGVSSSYVSAGYTDTLK